MRSYQFATEKFCPSERLHSVTRTTVDDVRLNAAVAAAAVTMAREEQPRGGRCVRLMLGTQLIALNQRRHRGACDRVCVCVCVCVATFTCC